MRNMILLGIYWPCVTYVAYLLYMYVTLARIVTFQYSSLRSRKILRSYSLRVEKRSSVLLILLIHGNEKYHTTKHVSGFKNKYCRYMYMIIIFVIIFRTTVTRRKASCFWKHKRVLWLVNEYISTLLGALVPFYSVCSSYLTCIP